MQKKIILLARERGAEKNVQGKRNVKEARICVRVETRTTPERVVLDQLDQKVNRTCRTSHASILMRIKETIMVIIMIAIIIHQVYHEIPISDKTTKTNLY
jgi:hypothetical protein